MADKGCHGGGLTYMLAACIVCVLTAFDFLAQSP